MDCQRTQALLGDLARGELALSEATQARDHVAGCADCARQLKEYEALTEWLVSAPETAPAELSTKVETQILSALAEEAPVGLGVGRWALAVAGGLATVMFHATVLNGRVDPHALSAAELVTITALWSALAIGAFGWMVGHPKLRGIDLSPIGLFALLTSGLGSLGLLVCPQETYFALWENSSASDWLWQTVGAWSSYAVFGIVYGLPPALVVSSALGDRVLPAAIGRRWLVPAGAAVLLWLPATYVQCSALGPGLLIAWAAGAVGGLTAGSLGGIRLRDALTPVFGRMST